ncbi:hypothetical protein FSP39_012562 [Pinctada imbricata]|uniref:C3H1-type domain-containing protein n=1 Tax=Pinctada imbricata TaxID=66713 RepID=A0AA89C9X7_PINIB|nr:hypothetical protein FSP39_012562 [Pinctada imbricata]
MPPKKRRNPVSPGQRQTKRPKLTSNSCLIDDITNKVTERVTASIRTEMTTMFQQLVQGSNSIPSTNSDNGQTSDSQPSNNTATIPQTPASDERIVEASIVDHIETVAGNSGFVSTAVPIQAKVSDKIKAKIWSNQFVEMKALLDNKDQDAKRSNFHLKIDEDEESGFIIKQLDKRDSDKQEIQSLSDWITAWNRYAAIYCTKYNDKHLQLAKHMETVRDIAEVKGNWRFYDKEFRQLISQGQVTWGDIHMELYVNARLSATTATKSNNLGTKRHNVPIPKGACYQFHSGKICNAGRACKHQHSCFNCGAFHPFASCNKTIQRPFRVLERFQYGTKTSTVTANKSETKSANTPKRPDAYKSK